jgi:hypothetical protein
MKRSKHFPHSVAKFREMHKTAGQSFRYAFARTSAAGAVAGVAGGRVAGAAEAAHRVGAQRVGRAVAPAGGALVDVWGRAQTAWSRWQRRGQSDGTPGGSPAPGAALCTVGRQHCPAPRAGPAAPPPLPPPLVLHCMPPPWRSPAQAVPLAAKPAAHDTATRNVALALTRPAPSVARHVTVVSPSGNAAALTPAV